MKIQLIFLFCLLFWANLTFTQWEHIATIGNYELRAVKFFNENTGIVAGQGGIWRSTNGGVNWTQVLTGYDMNSLSFPDNNVGYAVGDSGKVFKTIDGGISWNAQVMNTTYNLNGVSFFNQLTGFTVGNNGVIYRTINGGGIWNQNNNQVTHDLNAIQMIQNQNTAIAVGSNTGEYFTSTANGGTNWIYTLSIPNNSLSSVSYIPGLNGHIICVGGNGRIRKSTNFGASWTLMTAPATNNFYDVQFLDANTGYIAGGVSVILKTTNSGLNWFLQTTPTSSTLKSINFINLNTGWAVGVQGVILRTGIPVSIVNETNEIPGIFTVYQNYPNPFNSNTVIKFNVSSKSLVSINVYDFKGSLIKSLLKDKLLQGNYSINFNGTDYASGIYIYEIIVNNFLNYKKMILVK